jgi:hypothetical protein
MPRTGWTPSLVPCGADQTVYLVIDGFGGRLSTVYRKTEIERADLDHFVPAGGTWMGPPPIRTRGPIWPGLALRGKQLAPAARADVALNEFAHVRRLEIDAAVAVLIALRRTLIFGVRLADLLLRCRLRDRRCDCRRAECKCGAGERRTA